MVSNIEHKLTKAALMTIFAETMTRAISDYRLLLRRHLSQVDRMAKLQKLKLRDSEIFESDVALYEVGIAIVKDIEESMSSSGKGGYYSYSGINQFAEYLREYLSNYGVENNCVVHRAQKASRAMLSSIQLISMPKEKLDEAIVKKLLECNKAVVEFGSQEQCDLYLETLARQQAQNPGFYTRIIAHLESMLTARQSIAA